MPGCVVWEEGFRKHKGFFSEKGVFEDEAFQFQLIHSFSHVEIVALRVMEYSTVEDNEFKTLMIGETAQLPFNQKVLTKYAPSGYMPAFTVYSHHMMLVRTDRHMHVCIKLGQSIFVGQVKAYYTDTLRVWVNTVKRVFKKSGMHVEDYKFSQFDYESTVPVRDMEFLHDRTTFESVFGEAKKGVLYAYWRHEDKAEPPRRLVRKARQILHLREPQQDALTPNLGCDQPLQQSTSRPASTAVNISRTWPGRTVY